MIVFLQPPEGPARAISWVSLPVSEKVSNQLFKYFLDRLTLAFLVHSLAFSLIYIQEKPSEIRSTSRLPIFEQFSGTLEKDIDSSIVLI